MHYIYKFACISLGFGLITACDHEDTTPRSGPVDSIVCGGFLGLECPDDLVCVDDPADDCDPSNGGADCSGICQDPNPTYCGGFGGIDCPKGEICVDDPADDCDPNNGGADCIGICEPALESTSCGGFAGIECPKGQTCVDDPADDCIPSKGDADCIGICEPGSGDDGTKS